MQFLFVFLLMIGIVIGCHHHMSNRPPRKVIRVIQFTTPPQPQPAPEINPDEIRDLPDPIPHTVPTKDPPKSPWPF